MFDMMETALQVQFPFNMIIILGGLGIMLAAITVIATEIRKYKTDQATIELKQEMVAQGMSADEIVRVLNAGREKEAGDSSTQS